ncbi:MAG: hypothetical protein ACK5WS_01070 [Alphaproteobacteria bacterium]|jgi:hypothetical protein|nr:hypothetical protein [Candidatus Jidaibacter sp.]
MNPIILSGAILSAIAFGLYKATRPYEFTPETLKIIRMENEKFLKLLEIMNDIKHNGLKQAVAKYVTPEELGPFINNTLFENFSKSNTRLCECKVGSIFFKASTDIFEKQYNEAINHTPFYYQSRDESLHIVASNNLLSIIKHHPYKYDALFDKDAPVVSSTLFWGDIDYKKLAELVLDPEQKLADSLSCDDYTPVERLHIQKSFLLEFANLNASEFKKDLLEFHNHFYNKDTSNLISEVYGSDAASGLYS